MRETPERTRETLESMMFSMIAGMVFIIMDGEWR